jgi:hypothetical protein
MLKAIGLALSVVASLAQGTAPPSPVQGTTAGVAAPPSTAREGTAVLSGTVSRLDTERPIPGALLQLQRLPANRENPVLVVRTDQSGAYRFEKLPAGSYSVLVTAERFFPQDATTTRPNGQGKRVDLTEGQQLDKYDLTLVPSSAIEGRTLDEFGDPAPGVTMMLTQLIQAAGRSRLMPIGGRTTAVTDDRGMFRVSGLAPGDYYLIALSGPFGTVGTSALSTPTDTRAGFAPTYFPGTANAVDARPVHLEIGRDATGVSFGLVPSKLFTVSGRLTDAAGTATAGQLQMLQTQGGDVRTIIPANAIVGTNGSFVYRNVPQGTYVLQARSPKGFGMLLLTVSDRDVTDLAIAIQPPRTARGRITFDGGTPPARSDVQIAVRPVDFVSGPVGGNALPRVKINDDWTFELPGLQSVGVVFGAAPPNWQIRRATVSGEDVTDKAFDFRSREVTDLEIVLSDQWGSVQATVTDVKGAPAPDCTVLVFSQDATKWTFPSRHISIGRTNQQGIFRAGLLPGGAYLAVAVPQGVAMTPEVDAATLESLRAAATRISLTEGSETPVALTIVR